MKKNLIFILLIFFVARFSVSAQEKKIQFHSINSFELINGESGFDIGYQSVNGIRFSNWFSGIGIGVDNYRYKTLPLFAEGRWFFGNGKRGFVYGDLGYNFPLKDKPGKEIIYYGTYHFTGGNYIDLGTGYQLPLDKKFSMVFSLGYSYKKMGINTHTGPPIPCPNVGVCNVDYRKYNFDFNRMILKAGLIF